MNTAKTSDNISLGSAATVLISNRKATRSVAAAQNDMADEVPFNPSIEENSDLLLNPSSDPSLTTNRPNQNPVEDIDISNRNVGGSPKGPDQRQSVIVSYIGSALTSLEDEELDDEDELDLDDDLRAEKDAKLKAVEAEIKAAKAEIKAEARQRKRRRKRNLLIYLNEQRGKLRNQNRDNDDDESDSKPAAV